MKQNRSLRREEIARNLLKKQSRASVFSARLMENADLAVKQSNIGIAAVFGYHHLATALKAIIAYGNRQVFPTVGAVAVGMVDAPLS